MTIIYIIIGIFIFSFFLALRSLKNLSKMDEMKNAHEDLKKDRVIFQKDSSSSFSS